MLGSADRRVVLFLAVCVIASCVLPSAAMAQAAYKSLEGALSAFSAKDYSRAATLARMVGDRTQAIERDSARYLEGISLFKAGNLEGAANALRTAAGSTDRFISGQAGVTLGSVEIERRRFDAAGHAYRRAATALEGAEATRAHSIAARCFDGAGLSALAQIEREAAGEPNLPVQAAATARASAAGSAASNSSNPVESPSPPRGSARPATPPFKPGVKSEPKVVTEDDRPAAAAPAKPQIAPIRFAIQVGAYSTLERANEVARGLRPRCVDCAIEMPRVVAKESQGGETVHVVQFGSFPNRGAASKALLKFPRSAFKIEVYLTGADQSE